MKNYNIIKEFENIHFDAVEIIKLITSIIVSSKRSINKLNTNH